MQWHDGAVTLPNTLPGALPTATVTAIHATPHKMVAAFAGAGSQALAWLHGVGGSSRTILSAIDIYAPQSMRALLGFTPARFTSRRVARLMAARAHDLAFSYLDRPRLDDPGSGGGSVGGSVGGPAGGSEGGSHDPIFGLGLTATIATDREKRGDHRAAVAVRDGLGVITYDLTIAKGERDRTGEENLVSLLLLQVVAEACGVFGTPVLPLVAGEEVRVEFHPSELLAACDRGEREVVVLRPEGRVVITVPAGGSTVLSGSFNPVHDGHLSLAEVAAQRTGLPVLFELPLVNAAKAPIALTEARRRALQFGGVGPLALTRAPLFEDKAQLLPGSVFVVGVDTAERVVDPRFYDGDPARLLTSLRRVRERGCRFLVAGRAENGKFRTLAQVPVPDGYRDLFEALDEDEFRVDVSSTQIRSRWYGRGHASD